MLSDRTRGKKAGTRRVRQLPAAAAAKEVSVEPVEPLHATTDRWVRKATVVNADSPAMMDGKVKGLLNKLSDTRISPTVS